MKSRYPSVLTTGVALLLLASGGCSRSLAAERKAERVFVSNEDSGDITVLAADTGALLARIAVGKRPRGVRASQDGGQLYVALSGSPKGGPHVDETQLPAPDRSADGIGVVDTASSRLVRTLASGADPEAFDIAGGKLFVSNEDAARTSIIALGSGKLEEAVPVGEEPEGVTARPDGGVVYVTSEAAGEVHVIDTRSRRVVARVKVGQRPRSVAFSANGARAYVTNELSGSVSVLDAQRHRVEQTLNLPPSAAGAPPPRPMGIVLAPDGEHAYVTTGRGRSVVELELRGGSVMRILADVGARPWGIGITGDGKQLFVANGPSNDVAIIDTQAWRVTRRIPVGSSPWGVAVARVAVQK